jgi:hypothetical protein
MRWAARTIATVMTLACAASLACRRDVPSEARAVPTNEHASSPPPSAPPPTPVLDYGEIAWAAYLASAKTPPAEKYVHVDEVVTGAKALTWIEDVTGSSIPLPVLRGSPNDLVPTRRYVRVSLLVAAFRTYLAFVDEETRVVTVIVYVPEG